MILEVSYSLTGLSICESSLQIRLFRFSIVTLDSCEYRMWGMAMNAFNSLREKGGVYSFEKGSVRLFVRTRWVGSRKCYNQSHSLLVYWLSES